MEVVIGKMAGFCPGVQNAVKQAKLVLENKGKVYCLGEIVHNKQVINSLENMGMVTVDNIDEVPNGENLIFRAHGEAEQVYKKVEEKNLKLVDLTCGKVKLIHDIVKKKSENYFIIVIGKKNHPETIGTKGFAGSNSYIVETEDDVLDAYIEYEKTCLGKVYVVSQTTISSKKFDDIAKEVEYNFAEAEVIIDKTICNATELRQSETKKMAKSFDSMVIIGGKNSSNTKELFKIAEKYCEKVYLVETVEELKSANFSKNKKIGIMAGASTPKESIEEVKLFLENFI